MKNYAEKSDLEINKAVEKLQGMYCEDVNGKYIPTCDYCNDISVAWPIIFDNRISLCSPEHCLTPCEWWAEKFLSSESNNSLKYKDKNPLRAAMIVYLMLKDDE